MYLTEKRILVATDCLSEGISLQHLFSAVVHYDLSWNPARHEQREGRVDRFGQKAREVRSTRKLCTSNVAACVDTKVQAEPPFQALNMPFSHIQKARAAINLGVNDAPASAPLDPAEPVASV